MPVTPTLAILLVSLALAGFCGWRGARAPDPNRGPRLVPWQFLMMILAVVAIFCFIHLARGLGLGGGGA